MVSGRKYVFLTLKSEETEFLYDGFNNLENGCLISINRGWLVNKFTRPIIKDYTENGRHDLMAKIIAKKKIINEVCQNLYKWKNESIVFLVYARVYESFGKVLTDELKMNFPKSILCVYYGDLQKRFTIDRGAYERDFDYLFSFDQKESKEYGLNYLLEPFTYKKMDEDEIEPIYDITYVGRVKGDRKRHDQVIGIYKQCRDAGLKCDFHIVDAPTEIQEFTDDIEYNNFISFRDIMKHVVLSKTVLEILQTDEYSPTTRYTEACIYNRNLITNCEGIKDGTYPSGDNVFLLDDTLKVDTNWIKEVHSIDTSKYKSLFSIESVIETIDRVIDNINCSPKR